MADNKVYSKHLQIVLDLFTEYKDETAEENIESLLDAHELYWEKSEDFIEELHIYMITYSIII